MNVSPFSLLRRSTVRTVLQRSEAAVARWEREWCALPSRTIRCEPLTPQSCELPGFESWRSQRLGNGAAVWHWAGADMRRCVTQALFAADTPDGIDQEYRASPIASDIVGEALDALMDGLLGEISGFAAQPADAAPIPEGLFRNGSGAAICMLSYRDCAIKLVLPANAMPQAAQQRAAVRAPLTPLHLALRDVRVKLGVELSRAELTLGYLNTLAVGDVLALPAKVDQTLRVLAPGEVPMCEAHLGSAEGKRAVELIRPPR